MIETKKEFFRELTDRTGVPQNELMRIYGHLTEMVIDSAKSKEEGATMLPDIGRIHVRVQAPYISNNPRTNEKVLVDAKRRANFKLFPKFVESVRKV